MANFKEPFDKVILAEGGYTNDKDDSGGETYLGITRVHEAKSSMWPIVDQVKKRLGYDKLQYSTAAVNKVMTAELKKIPELLDEARRIYKKDYWDKMSLDSVPSQALAFQLFDHGVNAGVPAAIMLAKELVGLPKTATMTNELLKRLSTYGTNK